MKIIEQSWEFLTVLDGDAILALIEVAGRTRYKSENKITATSAKGFFERLLKSGHVSVIEHPVITVRVITDRGVTHEIVRHRIASYSQESTRFCNYGKLGIRFIKPCDFALDEADLALLEAIERHYNHCLEIGRTPQQARYFLPNGLKTEIVITYNIREWRHFFTLRCSEAADPQMRDLSLSMLKGFRREIPVLFDDIYPEAEL